MKMKKHILIAILLTFGSFESMAQFKVDGVNVTTITGSWLPGGASNSIVINNAGNAGTTSSSSVIIGNNAGSASNSGHTNVFIGKDVGSANTSGSANTFLGSWTGVANTLGIANTFVGQYCGMATTTGGANVFVGQGAGSVNGLIPGNVTGNSNTALGAAATFASGALTNATAIGANTIAAQSNSIILGPHNTTTANTHRVGIGTNTPDVHLHTRNVNSEDVKFETTTSFGSSTLWLETPNNDLQLFKNGSSLSSTFLPGFSSVPALSAGHLGGMLTQGGPMVIGIDGHDAPGSIHFINQVSNTGTVSGTHSRTECMRIDNTSGFTGLHTRRTGNGQPQALFHVNLTNPVNGSLNTATQGIRFQGLPTITHPDVVVIDSNGNLAKAPYIPISTQTAWYVGGNTTVGNVSEYIGTNSNDDFRIRTDSIQRARFTNNGNFDLGVNNSAASGTTTTSATIGTNNTLDGAISSIAIGTANDIHTTSSAITTGTNNSITNSSNSAAFGEDNVITQSSHSFAGGLGNTIDVNSSRVFIYGYDSKIESTDFSGIIGEENDMINGHGCFIGGGHNNSDGYYQFVAGSNNTVTGSHNFVGGHHNFSGSTKYNVLLGSYLRAETTPTAMPSPTSGAENIMLIGEQIHSNLNKSLTIGFEANKTTVITSKGMSVQLDPNNSSTYVPTVNFEVDAAVGTSPGPQSMGTARSNIRFHNLPANPTGGQLPVVLIDPATGELFQSTSTTGQKGGSNSPEDIDDLRKENSGLKAQLAEMAANYDEKFALLERMINQICDGGCAGFNKLESDEVFQSIPNPSGNNATISYYLARDYRDASISLYGMDGRILNTFTLLPNKGNGSINIAINELQRGVYLYELVVNGRKAGAKKLQKL
jgi:hypothetical protein